MDDVSPPQLDYAQKPRRQLTPRQIRIAIGVASAILLLWLAPIVARRAILLYWQRQCMNHVGADGQVIWEPDRAIAMTLTSKDEYLPITLPGRLPGAGYYPKDWS